MDGSGMTASASVVRLRRSLDENIAIADAMGLSLVAIWLEHARQELGPYADVEPPERTD